MFVELGFFTFAFELLFPEALNVLSVRGYGKNDGRAAGMGEVREIKFRFTQRAKVAKTVEKVDGMPGKHCFSLYIRRS